MKKFTKFMLSVAAMTAVSASLAVSAMAADTVTGTYDKDTGVVALSNVVSSGDQQTLLVLNQDVTVTSANASAVIAQIDQAGAISEFVLPANLTSGTYYIRIGGSNGTIQTGTLTIAEEQPGEDTTAILYIGDVNYDGYTDVDDATAILKYAAEWSTGIYHADEETSILETDGWYEEYEDGLYYVGDVNADGYTDVDDATAILKYAAEWSDGIGNCDEEIEVYKLDWMTGLD